MPQADDNPVVLCLRCGRELTPGRSDFYVVRIESYADPTAPNITSDELAGRDLKEDNASLVEELGDCSEQELVDEVYRQMTIHLCGPCYRQWIENPVG